MNPSSSGKYFQDFDKFLQKQGGKCSSSSAATASSSFSSSSSFSRTVFDRFSSQFDKQFGQPLRRPPLTSSDKSSSLNGNSTIVDMLSRDRKTQKSVEVRQQEIARSLKARELHLESTRIYNKEQDQLCHGVGVHPDSYKLHEVDDDKHSSGSSSNIYIYIKIYIYAFLTSLDGGSAVHNRSSILYINYYVCYDDDGLLLFDNTDQLYARSVVILRWKHSVWA